MAKKLGQVTNPITTAGGNIFSPTEWISRIIFVVWIGAIFAIGSKVLSTVDRYTPGAITPSKMQNVTGQPVVGSSDIVF